MMQYDLDGLPPRNLDAEQSVLGSMLLDETGEAVDVAAQALDVGDFYDARCGAAFNALAQMRHAGEPVDDVLLLSAALDNNTLFKNNGGSSGFVTELLEVVPHGLHCAYYARLVRQASDRRKLIYSARRAIERAYEPTADLSEVISTLDRELRSILQREAGSGPAHVATVLHRLLDQWATEDSDRLPTGFPDLDRLLNGGLRAGTFTILAARPSLGKTSLAGCIAMNAARNGNTVLFCSLEQSSTELVERMLVSISGLDSTDLQSAGPKLTEAQNKLAGWPIVIDDRPGQTVQQIAATARLQLRQRHLKLLIVDYLTLIKPEDPRAIREQQVSAMSRALKSIAKELEIPVLCLAQLNRQIESRDDKRPRLSDLRESGAIEQDADIVAFLHRPQAYNSDDSPGEATLIVAKHRNGKTGNVRLTWSAQTLTFRSGARAPYDRF